LEPVRDGLVSGAAVDCACAAMAAVATITNALAIRMGRLLPQPSGWAVEVYAFLAHTRSHWAG
jgi:hypothetical protein